MVPMTGADRLRSLAPVNKTLLRRLPLTTDESLPSVSQTSAQLRAPASTRASRSEGTTGFKASLRSAGVIPEVSIQGRDNPGSTAIASFAMLIAR